jgi:hypothetical protein
MILEIIEIIEFTCCCGFPSAASPLLAPLLSRLSLLALHTGLSAAQPFYPQHTWNLQQLEDKKMRVLLNYVM